MIKRRLVAELLEARRVLAGGEIALGGQTDVFDQPYVSIELRSGNTVIGPTGSAFEGFYPYNRMLLDTGANGLIAVSDAVTDMEGNGYQVEGEYEEVGVSGVSFFDLSAPYELRFSGTDEVVHTLPQTADGVRIMSNGDMQFGIPASSGGIPGIVGMPAMVNRVTTMDMSGWSTAPDIFSIAMGVTFAGSVPAGNGHRYSVPVDTRVLFDPRDGLPEGSPPDAPLPTWAPIPFLDVMSTHLGTSVTGSFLLDTGAQISMLSSGVAFDLGLDENGNGSFLDEAVDVLPVIGVGGTVEIPLLLIDELSLITEQGTLLTFAAAEEEYIVVAIHDIAPGIEGILGADLLTSGLGINYETFGVLAAPYFSQIHMDFRDLATAGAGTLYFDLSAQYDVEVPLSAPPVLAVGGSVTYTENQPAVLLDTTATLSDADSSNFAGGRLTVAITANGTATDRLVVLSGGGITLEAGQVSFGGTAIGTVAGGIGEPLAVSFNANATPEAVQALVQRIGFRAATDRPSTLARTVTFTLSDGDGGVSDPDVVTVNVVALNDAPRLDATLSPTLATILEDASNPRGTPVGALLVGAYSDPDGAGRGIAITGATGATLGTWQYTLNDGATWHALGAVSSTEARLLPANATTRVRFLPGPEWSGQVRLYYRAWDRSQGLAGGTFNIQGFVGGTGAFSVSADYAPLIVAPVNDRPVITGSGTVGYTLNGPSVALASGFALTDADSRTFGGGRLRIRITSGVDAGNRLFVSGGFTRSGNDILWNGRLIGTLNAGGGVGGTALVISLTDNATVNMVQLLIRSIRFRTAGSTLTDDRVVEFRLFERDGTASNAARSRVQVQ